MKKRIIFLSTILLLGQISYPISAVVLATEQNTATLLEETSNLVNDETDTELEVSKFNNKSSDTDYQGQYTNVTIENTSSQKEIYLENLEDQSNNFTISIPETNENTLDTTEITLEENGIVTFEEEGSDFSVGIQPIEAEEFGSGVRSMITITSKEASKNYEFDVTIPEGDYLDFFKVVDENEQDGSIAIFNSDSEIIGLIDAPWAKDADGNNVPTHYEIQGNKVIQTIEFTENTSFPIVADPTAWQITKCAASILSLLVGVYGTGGKVIRAINFLRKAKGGWSWKYFIQLLWGARKGLRTYTRVMTKARALSLVRDFIAYVTGISGIINNCSWIWRS